jgi:hypothetical protein
MLRTEFEAGVQLAESVRNAACGGDFVGVFVCITVQFVSTANGTGAAESQCG